MAIFDYDGTSTHEIGKIYEQDQSATITYQIGKMYDYDGTSTHLIYSAVPDYLYNAGDTCSDYTGGWAKTTGGTILMHVSGSWDTYWRNKEDVVFNSANIACTTSGSGQYRGSQVQTVNRVDLSGVSKLTFNYTSSTTETIYRFIVVAVCDSIGGNILAENITTTASGSITLDVSSISTGYVLFCAYTSDGYYHTKYLNSVVCTAA
mgnify:FL=1